jgi:hypothetical protein
MWDSVIEVNIGTYSASVSDILNISREQSLLRLFRPIIFRSGGIFIPNEIQRFVICPWAGMSFFAVTPSDQPTERNTHGSNDRGRESGARHPTYGWLTILPPANKT